MCTLGDAAITGKSFGAMGAVHAEISWPQVGPFGGLLAFYVHNAQDCSDENPCTLTNGFSLFVLCPRGVNAHVEAVCVR